MEQMVVGMGCGWGYCVIYETHNGRTREEVALSRFWRYFQHASMSE
jgi:hypothetical protein